MLLFFVLTEVLTEFIFWYINKDDASNIMNNTNFIDKMGVSYFFIIIIIYKNE